MSNTLNDPIPLRRKVSSMDLIGFSVNQVNLVKGQSSYGKPLLEKKPVDEQKYSIDHDDTMLRKQSSGMRNYLAQLRNANQPQATSVTDFSTRLYKLRTFTIIRWILLCVSVIGGASFGPFMLRVSVPSVLKVLWRIEITALLLIPFIIYEKRNDKFGEIFRKKVLFEPQAVRSLVIVGIGKALWLLSFVYALNYTSVAHASLFSSIPSLIIIAWRRIRGEEGDRFERIGMTLSLVGAVLVLMDNSFHSYVFVDLSAVPFWKRVICGDFTALIGSFFATLLSIRAGKPSEEYPLYFGVAFISVIEAIFLAILALIFGGATIGFSPETGLFGCFSQQWLFYYILVGLITGIANYVIQSYIAIHLDGVYLSAALYFEPVVSSAIVYLLGWQSLPAFLAILGGFLAIVGMIVITFGQRPQEGVAFVEEPESLENNDINISLKRVVYA